MHEEAAAFEDQFGAPFHWNDPDVVDGAHGCRRAAFRAAEAGEVVGAKQSCCCRGHAVQIEWGRLMNLPAEGRLEGVRRRTKAAGRHSAWPRHAGPGEEALGRRLDRHDPDVRPEMGVQGHEQAIGFPGPVRLNEHALGPRVYAGIRPPGTLGHSAPGSKDWSAFHRSPCTLRSTDWICQP